MLESLFVRFCFVGLVLLLICSGCRSDQSEDIPSTAMTSIIRSPSETAQPEAESPIATEELAESIGSTSPLPEFQLHEPLLKGETVVSGEGPAGVPILIVDVSYMTVIGEGRVSPEGEFAIEVEPPLVEYSMVGILFDESKESPYTLEQLPCGEECGDLALVGLLFDRAPVVKP